MENKKIKNLVARTVLIGMSSLCTAGTVITPVYAETHLTKDGEYDVEAITGHKVSAEDVDSSCDGIPTDPIIPANVKTGSVTINLKVPWDVHEAAYVSFTEANTGDTYEYTVTEANEYQAVVSLPEGIYVTGGGLLQEVTGGISVSKTYVNVLPYSNQIVDVELISVEKEYREEQKAREEAKKKAKEERKKKEAIEKEEKEYAKDKVNFLWITDKKEDVYHITDNFKKSSIAKNIFGTVCNFGIPALVLAFLYSKLNKNKGKKKKKDDDDFLDEI